MPVWSALDEKLNFQRRHPESFESVEERIFTFNIRDGHKWSDGEPLTSEDFRYMWEDVLSERGPVPGRLRSDAAGRRQAAGVRGRRPVDGALHLGCAQPGLPAGARRRAAASAWCCPPHYMKQFHEKYQDKDKLDADGRRRPRSRTGRRCISRMARQYRPENPRPADARSLAQHHQAAGRAVRVRAQPVLPPRRRERAATALYRPVPAQRQLVLDHPGQDRRRRERPAVHRHRLHRLHLPQGCREALPGEGRVCGNARRARASRCCPISTSATRSGGRCCGTCACAAHCRWRSTGARSTWRCSTGWPRKAPTRCCRRARSTSRNTRTPGSRMIPTRPTRCSTRRASRSATMTASACCPMAARRRSSSKRPAKARWRPTCSNSSPITGARSASRCSSAPRSATCSAAARSAARS